MSSAKSPLIQVWKRLGPRFLPFADAATTELPLGRLLRLSFFQITVGMAIVLLTGTLNRVMIHELGVPASLVAAMVALPILFAPFRALIGHRSDHHRSFLGWRRVPYIWLGSLLQFGGLAIMPFALMVLSATAEQAPIAGSIGAALAFLLTGVGLHTTQTAGLALATDLAPEYKRPRVVALLYFMLLFGMMVSALVYGALLTDFSPGLLIRVIQGAAVITMTLNLIALWKQEPRNPERTRVDQPRPTFGQAWHSLKEKGRVGRLLVVIGLGTAGFGMQDIILEPYGAAVLDLSVSATTTLTAMWAAGMLAGFGISAWLLDRGGHPYRLAAVGTTLGVAAFAAVILSAPLESPLLFRFGITLIGFGGGLFAVGTLVAAMGLSTGEETGIALGAWGAVQATAAGVAVATGAGVSDLVTALAEQGILGEVMASPAAGYSVVYHIEIALLLATLVAIWPLTRAAQQGEQTSSSSRFGLADFPG